MLGSRLGPRSQQSDPAQHDTPNREREWQNGHGLQATRTTTTDDKQTRSTRTGGNQHVPDPTDRTVLCNMLGSRLGPRSRQSDQAQHDTPNREREWPNGQGVKATPETTNTYLTPVACHLKSTVTTALCNVPGSRLGPRSQLSDQAQHDTPDRERE